ncbi:tetratricopeptide repeat protein [Nitrospirillum sp. BR 11752]|uniref:tetratricopeptide repeat protein n=1 Tax=Nitrospirillum sp. BR 11752 TaxID=3104293 RepID=UPI002EC08EB3|nr:tetratricopeptide repeat protein [Nitrospirillum sp. BR 11752]
MARVLDPQELLERATAARRAGRLSEALDLASQAVALSRASGQTGGADLPQALTQLAQALRDLRRPAEARLPQEEAVASFRDAGDGLSTARALRHLGGILDDMAAHRDAVPIYVEMMALYQAAEVAPLEMANAVRALACNAEGRGDRDEAEALWHQTLERYAALDEVFKRDYGLPDNPGVTEARARLARLQPSPS